MKWTRRWRDPVSQSIAAAEGLAALNKNKVAMDAARMDALAIGEKLRVSFNELASKLLYYGLSSSVRRRFLPYFILFFYLHRECVFCFACMAALKR